MSAWQTTLADESGVWELRFQPEYGGRYRTRFTGPGQVPDETGVMEAVDGRWSIRRDDGSTDAGSYVLVTDDVVSFSGSRRTVVWQRSPRMAAPSGTGDRHASPGAEVAR